jgi:hypothetical protein
VEVEESRTSQPDDGHLEHGASEASIVNDGRLNTPRHSVLMVFQAASGKTSRPAPPLEAGEWLTARVDQALNSIGFPL